MIVLLLAGELSQTGLVDLALQQGVTHVLDLHARLSVPPLLAPITQHPPRALADLRLRRTLRDAPEQAVLLVLIEPVQLDLIQAVITAARPAAALEILHHSSPVAQINWPARQG